MKYSDYSLDQVSKYPIFEELCDMFFKLVINDSQKEKLRSILYEGGYKDYSLNSGICNIDNPYLEMQRRVSMAYLIVRNEDTFDEVVSNNITLFHGTNSKALSGIISNGLESTQELENEGIDVLTGERYNRPGYSRNLDFISLTDIYDIAEDYSETDEKDAFNVIIGTSVESISNLKMITVSSEISEVGIKDRLPLENIKMIGVPSDKIKYVKQFINDDNIKVLGVDGIEKRFYCLDSIQMDIYYDDYNKLKESLNTYDDINRMLKEQSSNNDNISKRGDKLASK